jgi:hypothetical protein
MNEKIWANYNYFRDKGVSPDIAASLVQSVTIASLDESLMSVYEDVKATATSTIIKKLFPK